MQKAIFKTVVAHELRILLRNKVLKILGAIITVMLLASIWSGASMLATQEETVQKIDDHESEMMDSLRTRITRIENNGMVHPGFIWDDPTYAYNTARNEGPKFAVKPVFPLQALSVGQSDIQPFYYKVYINRKQYLTYDQEIRNSYLQFTGNFDFSFVTIFLMPLLIIVFSYNILSSEREQGTWVLLKISNQSISKLMLTRIAIRYLLFSALFWVVVIPVFALLSGPAFLSTANWWWMFAMVSAYFAFWFAVSFFVNSFSMSSNINALLLILIWLFTGLLVPNILQIGLNKVHPIPSRIQMQTDERNAVNKYFEADGQELTKEVFSSPRTMIRQASIVTPGMVYGYGVIVLKSQEIKDMATKKAEDILYGQIEKQQTAISRLQFLSPALTMQEAMSGLAGTHWHQFNSFSKDVDAFRGKLQDFYYPKMLYDSTYRTFTVKDAEAIPVFEASDYREFEWLNLRLVLICYLFAIALLLFGGYKKMLTGER